MNHKRAAMVTLGCKVNWYDSQAMAESLKAAGFVLVADGEPADVYIVNTCAVTSEAERKSRQTVRKLLRLHPGAAVVAVGCSAQKDPHGYAAMEGLAAVSGMERGAVVDLADRAAAGERGILEQAVPVQVFEDLPADAQQGHTRAVLKIEDGCDAHCAYCIIPGLRGEPRSRSLASIRREAEALAVRGFREIVLVGINLGRFGACLTGPVTLADAVKAANVPGIARIRLGSLEPDAVNAALLDRLASILPLCPHFHLSLQSGSAETLKLMGRRYNPKQFMDKLRMIRDRWPDVGITTDVIVGFPGETEEEFAESCAFVAAAGFLKVHVFPYSRREGTAAAELPGQLPKAVKEARAAVMKASAAPGAQAFLGGMIGKTVTVLFEEAVNGQPGWLRGYTSNYVDVLAPADGLKPGEFGSVRLKEAEGDVIIGEINQSCGGGGTLDA